MKPQLYRGVLRSGLAVILTGTLMAPSAAAFAVEQKGAAPDGAAQQKDAGSVSSVAQQAAADRAAGSDDADGNVTIIVQLEDGGSEGVTPFSHLLGRAAQDRHAYFKDRIRDLVAQTPATSFFSADGQPDTPQFQELQDYYHAIDGFAVKAPKSTLDDIKAMDGVKNAFVERIHEVPADEGAQEGPQNQTSLDMTGADKVAQKGDGEFVVVIDSGLDVNHEAFKGDLDDASVSETEQGIADAKGQLGEGKNGRYVSEKIPFVYDYADHDADVDPGAVGGMDHGTHVAGIVAANAGDVRGTAPNAQIAMMKVAQSADGGIPDSALLAAFDDAVVLAPDSVNVSLGSDAGFSDAASAVYGDAIDTLRGTGATVNVAAGNSYTSGYKNKSGANLPFSSDPDSSIISSPSSLASAVSVASINNNERTSAFMAADGTLIPYVDASNDNAWGSPLFNALDDGTYEYVDGGIGSEADAARLKEAYPDGMDRKVAILVQRGGADDAGEPLTFIQKVNNLDSLSPYAVIFYDNIDTGLTSFAIDSESTTAIMVTKENGEKLLAAADKHITKKKDLDTAPSLAPRMSDFSSWGPNTDLVIKPEITAPGGNIYSTVPGNAYDYKSGTSMATPQMAGISALMHEYVDDDAKFAGMSDSQKADVVSQLLMSTANPVVDPMVDPDADGRFTYYSPRVQGSGLANVPAAMASPVYATVDGAAEQSRPKADLGESANGSWSFTVALHNLSDTVHSYTPDAAAMSEQVLEGLFLSLDQNWTGQGIDVTFSGDYVDGTVTVPAGGEARLTVNVQVQGAFADWVAANAPNGAYVEGFAFLKAASAGAVDLAVPYLGFYGDWDKQSAFDALSGSGDEHMVGNALMNPATNEELGKNPLDTYGDVDRTKPVVSNSTVTNAPSKLQPFTTLMRNARTLTYEYLNSDGQVVRRYDNEFVPKTTYSDTAGTYLYPEGYYVNELPVFDGRDDEGNPLPDGEYTLRRTVVLDTADAATQTLDQAFSYDTTKPVISNVQLEGEGDARVVSFDVADASWLAGVNFLGPDDDPADPDANFYQLIPGDDNYDGSSIGEPQQQADGTKVWHVSVPVSALSDEWSGWSGPGGDFPNTLPVYAWDYGSNASVRTDVVVNPVPAEGITLSSSEVALSPGQSGALTATLEPADATQTALVWESSDPSVVTVDGEGALQGVAEGTATVTVRVADNPAVSAAAQVTVANVDDATGIKLSQDSAQLLPDGTLPVTALVSDGFAAGGVQWASSNEAVVKVQQPSDKIKQVNQQATLVAQGQVGEADVTATVRKDGVEKTATIHVTVRPADYADFVIDEATGTLTGYVGGKADVSIPNDVTAIADGVFANSNIQRVDIPASVRTIGAEAFKSAHNLTSVTFEQGSQLTDIGARAFYGTQSLRALDMPERVTSLGDEVLAVSSVERVTVPAGVTAIPASAFENATELADVTIGDGVTAIGDNAFNACTALSVVKVAGVDGAAAEGLPSALASIGNGAFQLSGLASATLPESVRTIGDNAFAKAPLTSAALNKGLEAIGAGAFSETRVGAIAIPDTVTSVGAGAFADMAQLATVTVGAQVPAGQLTGAFAGDSSLVSFAVADGAANYAEQDGVLFSKDKAELVAYPAAKSSLGGVYTVPEGTVSIADFAFYRETGASRVDFPSSLRAVGAQAFAGSVLSQVILPDAFETVGPSAFADAASLTYANVGGATEIGDHAFSRCPSLATVNLRTDLNRLTTVGAYAFSTEEADGGESSDTESTVSATYDGALQAVELPDSVTEVGNSAFYGLSGMVRAHIGAGLASGAESLFGGAISLAQLTVSAGNPVYSAVDNVLYAQQDDGLHLVSSAAASPTTDVVVQNGTVKVDDGAFRNNRVITSVVLPEGLKEIGANAFNTCESLASVSFPDSLTTVGAAAFNWCQKLDFAEFGTQISLLGDPNGYAGNSAFSGALPANLIVRGGVDGTYVTSTIQDETVQESAYFGPGVKKLTFDGGGTVPKILVVPGDLESLSFPWSIGSYASDIRIYAPAGSAGYDVAKAAMDGTYGTLDSSMQLKEYTPLDVSVAADAALAPGATVNLQATAEGGVDGAKEFRFLSVDGATGETTVLRDWATDGALAYAVPADGTVPVVEVRDATLLTERAAVGFGAVPTVTLNASGLIDVSVGETVPALTATVDAPAGSTVAYQWYADGAPIAGATSATYQPAAAEQGEHAYRVVATVGATAGGATVAVASDPVMVRVSAGAAAVNTEALATAVAAAEQLQRMEYTSESWAPFAAALAEARAQWASPESQEAVDAALAALTAAQNTLVKAEQPAEKPDTTALAAAVEQAKALSEADYTPESWAPFAAALAVAENELADPQTDETVAAALDALQKAQAALVEAGEGPDTPDPDKPDPDNPDPDNPDPDKPDPDKPDPDTPDPDNPNPGVPDPDDPDSPNVPSNPNGSNGQPGANGSNGAGSGAGNGGSVAPSNTAGASTTGGKTLASTGDAAIPAAAGTATVGLLAAAAAFIARRFKRTEE